MEFGDPGTWLGLLLVLLCSCSSDGFDVQTDRTTYGQVRKERQENSGDAEDVSNAPCKIRNIGKHPWIIRFKFDVDPKSKIPTIVLKHRDIFEEYANRTGGTAYEQNKHTIMTGVLVSPDRVLTTHAWRVPFGQVLARETFFTQQYIWMYGYDFDADCFQRQVAKEAVWNPRSDDNAIGLLGDFGLYTPWKAFQVVGEPFLLQRPHPIYEISDAINALIEKPQSLVTFVFSDDKATNSDLLNDDGSTFNFIGLQSCMDMPNFKVQQNVNFEYATNTSFFCGDGIPGTWNMSRAMPDGRGQDGASGAVAFYNVEGSLLPLGLYDYWIGASGEPRFYATFTMSFFGWLNNARFPSQITTYKPSEDSLIRELKDENYSQYPYADNSLERSTINHRNHPKKTTASPDSAWPSINRRRVQFEEYLIMAIVCINSVL